MPDGVTLIATVPVTPLGGLELPPKEWIVGTQWPYVETDAVDLSPKLLKEVFTLYQRTYSKIGAIITTPGRLTKHNRWILLKDGGKNIACLLFTATEWGIKLGAYCTDGSPQAKAAARQFLNEALLINGCYAEISPPLEAKLNADVPVVPVNRVPDILQKHILPDPNDPSRYIRVVGNLGAVSKKMVGRPLLT